VTRSADHTELLPHRREGFAHASERHFAQLLDFYGIEWQYEPHLFVLEENPAGEPVRAFRPDFYLPGYDLHVEITTLRQSLVTKKNRKAREVMERYPGVRIKILYRRDYVALLAKYGLAPVGDPAVHTGGPSAPR
jgi:bifunctional protein TilS/HprT